MRSAISYRTHCSARAGLALALLLSGSALAHPLATDTAATAVEAGRSDLGDTAFSPSSPAPVASSDRFALPPPAVVTGEGNSPTAWSREVLPLVDNESAVSGHPDSPAMRPRSARQGRPSPEAAASAAQSEQSALAEADPEAVTVLREMRRSVVDAAVETFDVRKEDDGRVRFSLAGVDGFHYSAQGETASFGYGDSTLTVAPQGAKPGSGVTRRGPEPLSAQPGEYAASEFLKFILEILQYPLVWVTILLLVIAKITTLIFSRKGRKRTRRRRSVTRQQGQQTTAERKRQRVRVRFRIKRGSESSRLQKP